MPKVGNYVQKDYHNRFRSQRKSTWSDYNKSWSTRRSNALEKSKQLRTIANNFSTINAQAAQATTLFSMQNQNVSGPYANPTAVMSRVSVLV
ncbi:MAG: flagellar biosynthesis protein [Roseibium sp.]|uniref:flagellar biosynthesis protein n=1 Tax=Roseibium sp. TaxID=1936156 RepID=UPI002606D83D|nr:flagellar biosynthesis protein [Roseibium sp.]MCV0423905.1 flagellar biosynthesis protein [Roseibium sp.]